MEKVLPCCVYHSKVILKREDLDNQAASSDKFMNNVNRCRATDESFAEAITADGFLSAPDVFLNQCSICFEVSN